MNLMHAINKVQVRKKKELPLKRTVNNEDIQNPNCLKLQQIASAVCVDLGSKVIFSSQWTSIYQIQRTPTTWRRRFYLTPETTAMEYCQEEDQPHQRQQ